MKRLMLSLITVVGIVGISVAGTTITETKTGLTPTQALLLAPNKSLTYVLQGTFTGVAFFQKSTDNNSWETIVSSHAISNAATRTGTVSPGNKATYYRWKGSSYTAGSFIFTMYENDDISGQIFNNKKEPIINIYDESAEVFGNFKIIGNMISTATTVGSSDGFSRKAYLGGAIDALEGSVLVATTPTAGYGFSVVVALAAADETGWVGIAKSAVSTGSVVDVYYSGFVLALTTGTVLPGNPLVTTADAAGYLAADISPTTGADVGVALSAGNAAGGRTKIRLR